jgi:hypothetical protein
MCRNLLGSNYWDEQEEVALDERLQAVGVERFTGAPGVTRTRDLLIRSQVVSNNSERD